MSKQDNIQCIWQDNVQCIWQDNVQCIWHGKAQLAWLPCTVAMHAFQDALGTQHIM